MLKTSVAQGKRKSASRGAVEREPSSTQGPPWKTREDALRARHEAAYREARRDRSWPTFLRATLRGPAPIAEANAVAECRSEIARLGAELVAQIEAFQAARQRLDELTAHRTNATLTSLRPALRKQLERSLGSTGTAPERADPLGEAIGLVKLHASFARLALDGTSDFAKGGRPPDPARGRVAAEYAGGWTDPTTDKEWRPTARDLALLAICEGADELPGRWQQMSGAALIGEEARAMRPYLKAGGKK